MTQPHHDEHDCPYRRELDVALELLEKIGTGYDDGQCSGIGAMYGDFCLMCYGWLVPKHSISGHKSTCDLAKLLERTGRDVWWVK